MKICSKWEKKHRLHSWITIHIEETTFHSQKKKKKQSMDTDEYRFLLFTGWRWRLHAPVYKMKFQYGLTFKCHMHIVCNKHFTSCCNSRIYKCMLWKKRFYFHVLFYLDIRSQTKVRNLASIKWTGNAKYCYVYRPDNKIVSNCFRHISLKQ